MMDKNAQLNDPPEDDFSDPLALGPTGEESEWREVQVQEAMHGKRLDLALGELLPEFSRSYLQTLLAQGQIHQLPAEFVAGKDSPEVWVSQPGFLSQLPNPLKASAKARAGMRFWIELKPTEQSLAFVPQPMDLTVVYEDEHLRVIDKPAGLVVHPAPGHWTGTLLNGLLAHDEKARFVPRAGIVHRLDKDTSGLMVVARTRECMDRLVAMIAQRSVKREYMAVVQGAWSEGARREIHHPIGRDPRSRTKMSVIDLSKDSGKSAHTSCVSVKSAPEASLVYCQLHTGRTHQIRVHLSHEGYPIWADTLYGARTQLDLSRQALHAFRLGFVHPYTGQSLSWTSLWPQDLEACTVRLGLSYNLNQAKRDLIPD
jgi:23S rRNA pseudouridine1911/1915/1917 synthase